MRNQDTTARPGGGESPRGPNPTGARVHYPEHRWAREAADEIDGIPENLDLFEALYYLERDDVADALGCGDCEVKHLRFLLRFAKGKGLLEAGKRPIVCLTKSRTSRLRRISPKKLNDLEYRLAALGAIHWKDSSNYRRYRTTDEHGQVNAYGVDLAPLVKLIPVLKEKAEGLRREDAERRRLEDQVSAIRRHVRDELRQAMTRHGTDRDALQALLNRVQTLPDRRLMDRLDLEALRSSRSTAIAVQQNARALIDGTESETTDAVSQDSHEVQPELGSQGTPIREATIINTRRESCTDVVAADPDHHPSADMPAASAAPPWPERGNGSSGQASHLPEDIKGPAGEQVLEALSPRIARYLPPDRNPSMTDFVEAANRTRRDLKISPTLWAKARRSMSPGGASLALAHVAAKWDDGKIKETPGAYFDGIVKRAMAGELNLGASLWGMVWRHAERPPGAASQTPVRGTSTAAPAPNTTPPGRSDSEHRSPPAPLFPDDPPRHPLRTVANPVAIDRFCTDIDDPEGMRTVWLGLVRAHGRWPYLDEVKAHYLAKLGSQASPPSFSMIQGDETRPQSSQSAPRSTEPQVKRPGKGI